MTSVLAVFLGGSALAAESSGTAPLPGPASSAEMLPDEILSQLIPEPTNQYGVQSGPCTVSVTCIGGYTVNCYGDTVCYWKVDSTNPYNRGLWSAMALASIAVWVVATSSETTAVLSGFRQGLQLQDAYHGLRPALRAGFALLRGHRSRWWSSPDRQWT